MSSLTGGTVPTLLAFAGAAGVLTVTPGIDTMLVLRTAAVEGSRRAALAALGICLGCLTWGLAASVGLGALLAASRLAYDILRIAGAAYLILLGARLLLRPRRTVEESGGRPANSSGARWFLRGFLSNLLNPKVGVFYISFLPLFIPRGANVAAFGLLLAAINALEGVVWFALIIGATRGFARLLQRPRLVSALDRATGVVLVGFGLKLALDRDR